jgi:hypothetical protein
MSDKVRAYNVVMQLGNPTTPLLIAGHTDAGYDITPTVEDTLTKANLGVKQAEVIGLDEQFTVDSLMLLKTTGEVATVQDFTDLRKTARAGTQIAFSYGWHSTGKPLCTGTALITKYSEKTGASGTGTHSITLRVIGTVTDGLAT